MKIKTLLLSFLMLFTGFSSLAHAASATPVLNQPLHSEMSFDKAKSIITQAGMKRKWVVSEENKGVLIANIQVRSHFVSVEINVGKDSYDIVYRDSENMNYRSDGTIHRKYNGWVRNLNSDIQKLLISASK